MTREREPVVVIGAGVIGCAIAWELARRHVPVLVLERRSPGAGASSAAAGMLSPLAEAHRPGPLLDLMMASFERYPAFVGELREITGVDPRHLASGKLLVAFDEGEANRLVERRAWQAEAGVTADWLDGDQARRLVPGLSPSAVAALRVHQDHQVENRLLVRALWAAATRAGARFALGATVLRVHPPRAPGPGLDGRAFFEIELAAGERQLASSVVVAAGSWSGLLGVPTTPVPVQPVPGQVLALATDPPGLRQMLMSERGYLVPRADGLLLVGATSEPTAFRARPTAGGIHHLLAAALELVPGLGDAPLVDTWAGLRPGTPDELPILGEDPRVPGLFYATGHYRNGILLTPVTARIIADLVTGQQPPLPIDAFRPDRFLEGAP